MDKIESEQPNFYFTINEGDAGDVKTINLLLLQKTGN
jgi:hypothetical protein